MYNCAQRNDFAIPYPYEKLKRQTTDPIFRHVSETMYIVGLKVDKMATIRNRYNRIPYPALETKRERDTYN